MYVLLPQRRVNCARSLSPFSLSTARRYASAVYAVVVSLSVCPSVRLSQADIV